MHISHAAITIGEELLKGKSHSEIMQKNKNKFFDNRKNGYLEKKVTYGFLTNTNEFVDRYKAQEIAKKANQIKEEDIKGSGLVSEVIWSDNNFKYNEDGFYKE